MKEPDLPGDQRRPGIAFVTARDPPDLRSWTGAYCYNGMVKSSRAAYGERLNRDAWAASLRGIFGDLPRK